MNIATWITAFEVFVIIFFFVANGFYGIQLGAAMWGMRLDVLTNRGISHMRMLGSEAVPSVAVLVPAYNEAATVGQSVRSLLTLRYPALEVIVINDGSTDDTMAKLHEGFELVPVGLPVLGALDTAPLRGVFRSRSHPSLTVVDKENGGKADALNAGLLATKRDLVCAIDSDTVVEPDALLRLVRPFLHEVGLLASGGTVRVVNGSRVRHGRVEEARLARGWLPAFQTIEYIRAFIVGRLGLDRLGGNIVISGAFGLFRRQAIMDTGGYERDTVGEDLELVLRLRRRGFETKTASAVRFVPVPVAWTEVPNDLGSLGRQRERWHRGLMDSLWRHRRCFLNPRYRGMGLVVFPYFVLIEMLAPLVEAVGLVVTVVGLATGSLDASFALLFVFAAYVLGLALTLIGLLLDQVTYRRHARLGDLIRIPLVATLENFGYRQLTVYWRLRGMVRFFMGRKDWGEMKRAGFDGASG